MRVLAGDSVWPDTLCCAKLRPSFLRLLVSTGTEILSLGRGLKMTVTISANNTSVTVADASSILVTGTGDTVSTNSSTISFPPGREPLGYRHWRHDQPSDPMDRRSIWPGPGATEDGHGQRPVTTTITPLPYVIAVSGDTLAISDLGSSTTDSFQPHHREWQRRRAVTDQCWVRQYDHHAQRQQRHAQCRRQFASRRPRSALPALAMP